MKTYKDFSDYDMFGYNVGLYSNGHIKEGTLFGIISTIIYIFSFIGVTIYYINETFSRKNYTFSTSTMKHENIASIKLDKEIFALNFAMEDPEDYAEYIDETIYYIKANHITGIRDPKTQAFSWYYEEIKTGPCSLDMFGEENQRFFKDGYKNNYCLYDINKNNLTGHFVFGHYSKIIISFYPCVNSTENNNHCKPKNIIDYYLNNTYVSMLLQSITIDDNHIPMTRTYIENPFTTVSQYSFKNFQINLKIVETDDDTGVILSSRKKTKILQYDYITDMFAIKSRVNDGDSFCQINIKLSDRKTIYKRSFEKINIAFSKAGSIMTLVYTFIRLCFWLPVKSVYEINVINKVFRFDMNTANGKVNESHILKHLINFNSENLVKINRNNSNGLNFDDIKNENEENIKENYKNNKYNLMTLQKKSNTHINKLNIKKNFLNDSNIKRFEDNSGNMLINNILKKRSFNLKKTPNIFKENLENNQYKYRDWGENLESEKHIVDVIKFNCCQLLCYYPIRYCSNNVKINLAKKAQKFFRKTLDIISIFQNISTNQKIFKLVAKNQKFFGVYDKEVYYYNKPIITDDRIKKTSKNIEVNI